MAAFLPPLTPGSTALKVTGNGFHFDWQTNLAVGKYVLELTLSTGQTLTKSFELAQPKGKGSLIAEGSGDAEASEGQASVVLR